MITIAIDAMGGDIGPSVTVPASLLALSVYPDLSLILVGDEKILQTFLSNQSYDNNRLSIVHATQAVEMDEPPSQALRNKKDSSMRVAINLIKEEKVMAAVSAGNTGALMATARFVLKTLPGIDRPAIISSFPTINPNKCVRMLDLGANTDSTPDQLHQFAVMGSLLVSCLEKIDAPKVYLLNIGEEEIKGNELVKEAAQRLSKSTIINYKGYIEGDRIFDGEADVIVSDGFVGNIALKTTEGIAIFIGKLIKKAFMRNIFTKLVGLLVKPVLSSVNKQIDPSRYNGATFIGLNGTVIKSHGGANVKGFKRAIDEAILGVKNNIPEKIRFEIEKHTKAGK